LRIMNQNCLRHRLAKADPMQFLKQFEDLCTF
jgi:hypothetical protein